MARVLSSNVTTTKGLPHTKGPVELYDIYLDSAPLHFTTNNENLTFFDPIDGTSKTYIALAVRRDKIQTSVDTTIDRMTVGMDNVGLGMTQYIAGDDWRGRRIVVRKVFLDVLGASGDAVTIFDGEMDHPIVNEAKLMVTCRNRIGTLAAFLPRRRQDVMCNWKFADAFCANGVSADTLKDKKTGQTVDTGSTLFTVVDAARTEAVNYWVIGICTMTSGTASNVGTSRNIIRSSGGGFDVDIAWPVTPAAGDAYSIERNCEKTLAACSGDFANQVNFGGFNTIPQEMVIR